jgi:hypothetical protein
MVIALTTARLAPQRAAEELLATNPIFGLREAIGRPLTTRARTGASAVFDLTLDPLPAFAVDAFPTERLRLYVLPGDLVLAVDRHPGPRTYEHRYPPPLANLCLQYPRDPDGLRLLPEDGLEVHISCAHRHLLYEEAYRRGYPWPSEDAPHGPGRTRHPIRLAHTRRVASQWARP